MKILWKSQSITGLFPSISMDSNFFVTFRSVFGDSDIKSITKSLHDKSVGFSWRGRLVHKIPRHLTTYINLSISPVFVAGDGEAPPIGYSCHFDDITEENRELLRNTFRSLLEASKLKDNDTGNHIERVNSYAKNLAKALDRIPAYSEIDHDFIEDIGFLSAMHDVGKIGTPDDILNKNGPLEKWEWDIMKEHTVNGAYLLSTYPKPMAKDIALFHHEHWNGKGYPYGLSESMIPVSARIVAVADVYDALRSKRSYKAPISHDEACSIIEQGAGSHFDPCLIEIFTDIENDFESIYLQLSD